MKTLAFVVSAVGLIAGCSADSPTATRRDAAAAPHTASKLMTLAVRGMT